MARKRTNGELLRERREARGVNQDELAARAGYAHKASISRFETGARTLNSARLFELCSLIERIADERLGKIDAAEVLAGE